MKALVCMPTYNESGNLESIVEKVLQAEPQISILIIDDNSPDGTGKIADKLKEKDSRIHVLHRSGKLGLASAYMGAFDYAIKNGFFCAISMDADFSHDPKYLKNFLKLILDHDFVIGSRYVEGGGTKNWGIHRKIISKGGNLYANTFLSTPFKDLTGGFTCYRTETLKKIGLNTIQSEGYCFQVELKYRCHFHRFKGAEFPIIFEDRRVGSSKMSSMTIIEAMSRVPLLRLTVR